MRHLLAMVFIAVALPVFAAVSDPASLSRYEQRQLYLSAMAQIKAGQLSQYHQIKGRLADYALYPYLEYTERIYQISKQSPESIADFVDRYSASPLANQLLENWLYHEAKQGNWSTYLKYHSKALSDPRSACYHAYALYRENRQQESFDAAKRLWLVDHSQPDECNPIFKVWREADQLDPATAWQRYFMTATSGDASLASYLTRYLAAEDRALADNLKQVQQNPQYISNAGRFKSDTPNTREVILYGVRRLATRDAEAALLALQQHLPSHQFADEALNDAYAYVGVRLALDGDNNNLLPSLPIALRANTGLTEARIRLALKRLDWSQALVLMNLLSGDDQASPRWQYWKARVLMGSSDPNDRQQARKAYEDLAKLRSFYGFIAADLLSLPYEFEDAPAEVTEDEIGNLEATPGIQRALELLAVEDQTRARREWSFTVRQFSERELQIAARVAARWGWYRQSIQSMIQADAWNDLAMRFPLAYHDSFVSNARVWDIPLHWGFAIARQESAFMPDARSASGALGIMQLMPETARSTASQYGVSLSSNADLIDPALNIRIGSAYLGRLLRRYHNNRILASAAYNAGPTRVDRWVNPSLPLDVWIEAIPFKETRNYVQNVLMFSTIYARLLDQSQPLIYAHEQKDFLDREVTLVPAVPIITPVRPKNS